MPEPLRALSVRQPWLHAITAGTKRVENRSWPAPELIIGKMIALHASKTYDSGFRFPAGTGILVWDDLPTGAVTAVATVTGCHTRYSNCNPDDPGTLCSPWAARDQFHWLLGNVMVLGEPVPCRGMLGLWRLPQDVEKAVRAQLEGPADD